MDPVRQVYFCCEERRRNEVRDRPGLNGIDFLEVLDEPGMPQADRQRTLFVHFIHPDSGLALDEKNVSITGGERIRNIQVLKAAVQVDPRSGSEAPVLMVEVNRPGDFSPYSLSLQATPANSNVLDNFDPLLRIVNFSFKVNCPTDFDCVQDRTCPPEPAQEPAIDYLARDFASFRQLMLDRLAVLSPRWKERNTADLGVVLVELLAYMGDYLSYQQDAISTEAYLDTARSRVSARRHARLVDYFMHDGSNARAWVQVQVNAVLHLDESVQIITSLAGEAMRLEPGPEVARKARAAGAEVFETMEPADLFPDHNLIQFYTWGALSCCLPRGATAATLRGDLPDLKPGQVLVFQEVRSPRTGNRDDADLAHRHAVRLLEVTHVLDPLGRRFDPYPSDDPLPVTQIRWGEEDALPFPLCISGETSEEAGSKFVDDISVALGNIVLADHGLTTRGEVLRDGQNERVPEPSLERIPALQPAVSPVLCGPGQSQDRCRPARLETVPPRFRPTLAESPVTQAAGYDPHHPPASAAATLCWTAKEVLPEILMLRSQTGYDSTLWSPQRDLLNSADDAAEFVVEVEEDGRASLRFGDGKRGARPPSGAAFTCDYRVGNGERGNVGAGSLVHIAWPDPAILGVTNPLPAQGGREPETIEEVRQNAPNAFRTQARAVTPADYAEVCGRKAGVQRAAASLRWTGSWRTVFISVDRQGGAEIDDPFEEDLRGFIEPFRMAGQDVEIDRPQPVSLEIAVRVSVLPGYFRSHVKAALLRRFSRQDLFHPDNFTFGQTIFLSPLYSVAQSVEGVESVEVTKFQRMDSPGSQALDDGKLALGRLEIARLDNDPNFPDRGVFTLQMEGGK